MSQLVDHARRVTQSRLDVSAYRQCVTAIAGLAERLVVLLDAPAAKPSSPGPGCTTSATHRVCPRDTGFHAGRATNI